MSWLAVLCLVGVIAICSAAPQAALKWSHLEPAEELHNWNLSPEAVDAAFAEFKLEHERKYESESEEMLRKAIFTQHLKTINMHNYLYSKGLKTYTMGVNKYTDVSHKEFVSMMNGWQRRSNSSDGSTYLSPNVKIDLPDMVDWRDKGYVTPVKDQKDCGSCWAFSTTGSLEGQNFRKTGKLVSLSEQNLVDCSKSFGNEGCNGGLMDNAFKYIKSNNGIDTEESYPYEARDDTCRYKAEDKGATDTGFVDVTSGDESKLQEAVATVGPVSVAIDASNPSFQMYKNGIYNEESCSSENLDHGVLAVGYGTLNGADYWLVKNRNYWRRLQHFLIWQRNPWLTMAKCIMLCCLFIIIPWVTCNESCGKSKYLDAGDLYLPPAEAQIVGGLEARPNEFPWQVSLRYTDSPILEHFCGGAIINRGWILTAAHCLKQKYIKASSDFFVVVGGHNIRETINIKYHKVDKFIIHEEYTVYRTCNGGSISMFNDIALIKVTPPIHFNDDVSPVCLPDTEDLYVHRQSIVSGWGQLESDDCKCNGTEIISPKFLMYTTLNIPTTEFCQERLPLHLKESMMCASDNRGAKIRDSCQGDSGGPMTVKDNSSVFSVVGIVSLGIGCAYAYPGIYTRVSHFIDWINDTITRE